MSDTAAARKPVPDADAPEFESFPWPNALPIPRVASVTPEILESFVHSGMPAIFEGVIPRSMQERAHPAELVRNGGDAPVSPFMDLPPIGPELEAFSVDDVQTTTLSEYFDCIDDPERRRPCYATSVGPRLLNLDNFNVLENLHPQLVTGNLWIGSAGATIGLHCHRQAWVGALYGYKDVFLVHRKYSQHLDPVPLTPTWSRVDPRNPDFENNPQLREVAPYVGRIAPGEVLLIPDFMWHCLWPVTTSVTIHPYWDRRVQVRGQDSYDYKDFTLDIPKMFGWRQAAEIVRQAVWHGALGRPPARLNAIPGFRLPYGLLVWEFLSSSGGGELSDRELVENVDRRQPKKKPS